MIAAKKSTAKPFLWAANGALTMGLLNDTPAQGLLSEMNRTDAMRRARHRSFQQTGGTPWVDIANGVLGMIAEPIEAMKADAMAQYYGMPSTGEIPKNIIQGIGGAGLSAGALGLRLMPRGALAANVWQGSPHKYGPEGARESLKHIGKGEGAQAYGWGRYDAGAQSVGEQYKRALQRGFETADEAAGLYLKEMGGDRLSALAAMKDHARGGLGYSAKENAALRDGIKLLESGADVPDVELGYLYKHDLPDEDIARYMDWDAPLSEQPESVQIALGLKRDAARDAQINKRLNEIDAEMKANAPKGDTYDDLFGDNGGDIDWAALQMEKSALEREINNQSVFDVLGNVSPDQVTGRWLYEELMNRNGAIDWPLDATADMRAAARGSSRQAASEALARAGIPGLKYYDGSSRTAASPKVVKADDGYDVFWGNDPRPVDRFKTKAEAEAVAAEIDGRTRNYVTWDQDVLNRMKLLERNGEPMGLLDTVE